MPARNPEHRARIMTALDKIKRWMNQNGATEIVDNLAPGLTEEELSDFEADTGLRLPAALFELWSIHGGQEIDTNGFVGGMDLLSPHQGMDERDHILDSLEFMREHPDTYQEAGVTKEDAESDNWLSFANQGYADQLVVQLDSGRVYICEKDSPPFHLIASTIVNWVEEYASNIESGKYKVCTEFGGCSVSRDDAMY